MKRIKRTRRKMDQYRTVTQSTTTITARQSESKQVMRRTHIPQSGSRREGWKERRRDEGWGEGCYSIKPRTAGILRKFDTVTCT